MDIVPSIVSGILDGILDQIVSRIGTQFGYLINYNTNIKNLKDEIENLRAELAGLQQSVAAAKSNAEVIAPGVERWLTKVDEVNKELEKFLEQDAKANPWCLLGWCPDLKSRYSLGKEAKKKSEEVIKLQKEGKFDKIAYPAPLPKMGSMFSKSFKEFESRKSIMNEVMEMLKDDKINMIGVYGEDGVGKTTILKEVARRAQAENLFDEVVMADVSQNPNIAKVQGEIGDMLGLKFEEESVLGRATRLHKRILNSQRILIILDDVWTELDFENTGIPPRDAHNGCKILLASPGEKVCKRMRSQKNVMISALPEEEAWDLFQEVAGNCMDNPVLCPIAKEIAKECRGLPLAIVTVGKELRDKDMIFWEDTLQQIRNSSLASFISNC